MRARRFWVWAGAVLVLGCATLHAQRQMENLGRGMVALRTSSTKVYVGWRLLAQDPEGTGFNLYRSANGGSAVKLNTQPLTNTTDYADSTASLTVSNAWFVRPVIGGVEQGPSAACGLPANAPTRQYFPVPLQPVSGGAYPPYDVKFCWVGDLDGDGEYDFVADRLSTAGGVNQYLQAYLRNGTFLWQMDLGYNSTNQYNVEPGASAISTGDKDNVTVYDLDGDGRAEVIVRVARGTVLPDGTVVTGPDDTTQYLSVLDGLTGHERARALIPNPFFSDGPLGFHFGIVYCDGVHPSVLLEGENRIGSGSFNEITMAWDFRNGSLTQRWAWTPPAGGNYARGHQVRIADVNHDGIDDIVEIGSVNSGANGQPLFDTELGHGDRLHITDMDPDRPGLETYAIQQNNPTLLATALYDSATGKFIKKWYASGNVDVGRGIALDMDPAHKGCEMYSTQPGIFDCHGQQLFANSIWPPEGLWWDGDLSREFIDGAGSGAYSPVVNKFSNSSGTAYRLYSIYNEGVHQAYGGRSAFWGDIFGDWREELVLVANDYSELRVYISTTPATNRLYCLMQNPAYRAQATLKGYYEACYPDFYLGTDMQPPPPPPSSSARLVWRGGGANAWETGGAPAWFTNNLWVSNTTAVAFAGGDSVLFDLTGSNALPVSLSGVLAPGAVIVHSPKDYTFGGSGSLAGPMPLTKAGAGKLTLSGTNLFTGTTTIWEGPVVVTASLDCSPVVVRSGPWLDAAIAGTGFVGGGVTVLRGGNVAPGLPGGGAGTLTISNGLVEVNGAVNRFRLSDDASGLLKTNDLVRVMGNVTLTGTNTILVTPLNTNLPPGVYPLIGYSGALLGGISNLVVEGLPGVPVALTNPPGQLALVVKSYRPATTVTWTGGAGNAWDLLGSSNWLNGASRSQFVPLDAVRFDSTGATNPTVSLAGILNPGSMVVDSSSNYTWSGSGSIIGAAGLSKSNSGTLTITATANSFTGRTVLAGGTLVVPALEAVGFPSALGNPGAHPSNLVMSGSSTLRVAGESYTDRGLTLGAGTNSVEVPNAADQVTVAGAVVGAGALQKLGPGTLGLTASNAYGGGTLIRGGAVSLGGGNANQFALGTGAVTLDNGTLRMFSDSGSYDRVYWDLVVPAGSSGSLYADDRCNLYGSLTGGGTFNFYVYYVRTELDGNWSGFTGQLNVGTDSAGGDFRVGNSYGYANASVNLADYVWAYHINGSPVAFGSLAGGPLAVLTGSAWTVGARNSDATFQGSIRGNSVTKVGSGTWTLTGDTNSYAGGTTISGGVLQVGNGGVTGSVGTGDITNNALLAFNRADALSDAGFGLIRGNGSLSKRGSGTLALTRSHPFSGATLIEAGTLALTNAALLPNSSNIQVSAGAVLDVTGRTNSSLTVTAGKKLSGTGTVRGDVTIGAGALLAPGSPLGVLTFSNALTLAAGSTNVFELSKSPLANDSLRVSGPLALGGTLQLTNVGVAPLSAGDVFKLLTADAAAGAFAQLSPAMPSPGLRWDTSLLAASGVLKVVAAPVPRFPSVDLAGNFVVLSASGETNGVCYVLASTNVSLPVVQWTRVSTNWFDGNGLVRFTNVVSGPRSFYLLDVP